MRGRKGVSARLDTWAGLRSDIFYICVSLYLAVTFNKEKCAKSTTNDGSSCFAHGRALNEYLARAYPQATLIFDLTPSTATAMPRMITS
eukprot:8105684-Ditylum_brightwellii.AAC.1